MLVDEVPLEDRTIVERHESRAAPDDRQNPAETPGGALGVAHHLDVVAGVVDEAARQAIEGLKGRELPSEGGDDGREVGARGHRGGDAVQGLHPARGGPQLGVDPHVLESVADLLAEHLEELLGEGRLTGDAPVQDEDAEGALRGPQGRGGEPPARLDPPHEGAPSLQRLVGQPEGLPGVRGEVVLGRRGQVPVRPDHQGQAALEPEAVHRVLEGRAQEGLLLALDGEVLGQRRQRLEEPVSLVHRIRGWVRGGFLRRKAHRRGLGRLSGPIPAAVWASF